MYFPWGAGSDYGATPCRADVIRHWKPCAAEPTMLWWLRLLPLLSEAYAKITLYKTILSLEENTKKSRYFEGVKKKYSQPCTSVKDTMEP